MGAIRVKDREMCGGLRVLVASGVGAICAGVIGCGSSPLTIDAGARGGAGGSRANAGSAGSTSPTGGGGSGTGYAGTGVGGSTESGGGGSFAGAAGSFAGAGDSFAGTAGSFAGAGGIPGGAGVALCTNYCTEIMSACTGPNQQYSDIPDCMKACSYMRAGAPTDTAVNSVGCRMNAVVAATADAHAIKSACWQAGPLSYGGCGNDCDLFCTAALAYCSPAGGYDGLPPYASMDECENVCGLYARDLDFGLPGSYEAHYTPGATTDTTDTLECRAYQLFIAAVVGGGDLQLHCAATGPMSSACGSGPVIPTLDAGPPLGPPPVYDGGVVSIINETTWDETKYPPSKRKMLLRDEGDPHLVVIDLSKTPILQWKTVTGGTWARSMQLIGNNQILGGRNDGYEVLDYTTGAIVKTVKNFPNTQSAYRTVTGETMLTQAGTVLTFLDKADTPSHQISYPGFGYVRVARPTRNGTYLVPSDTTLFEGDVNGNVRWKATSADWGHIWEPLLMQSGDTLLCAGFAASCDVVDHLTHKVTKRYGTKQMPMAATINPSFFAEFEILPNGNIFVANWEGEGGGNANNGIQVLEFEPGGNLVWFWKQDPTLVSSIQGVQVLDGKDPAFLHVQETSADGTWQPVIPSPATP
jgi:hypothetical protein